MPKENKIKKVLVVFGTRPEAIKMAPLIRQLKRYPARFKVSVCVTAQHRRMLDQMLNLFQIRPDYDLDIMRNNQSLFEITAKGLIGIKRVLKTEKSDLVMVQGDTTTTFAASLAAFYLKVPVGHIEAGLRTYDKLRPFPEEINRRLTSQLADFHFVHTEQTRENLLREGIAKERIFLTGNTVIDALFYALRLIKNTKKFERKFSFLTLKAKKLILVTAHRRESFGKPLSSICQALKKISKRNKDTLIVYPVHPNPNVKNTANRVLRGLERVYLVPPLDYLSFVYLMSKSYLVLTDSGGIQEEAISLKKPILVTRDKTERPEGIIAGATKIVGSKAPGIIKNTEELLNNKKTYKAMLKISNPYGDGKAAAKITKILINKFSHA